MVFLKGTTLPWLILTKACLKEIITGGVAYYLSPNGVRTRVSAPFKMWGWNGKDFTLKTSCNWTEYIECVYAGDIDVNNRMELITSGEHRTAQAFIPLCEYGILRIKN